MIAGTHTIIFAEDAERARTFLRDVLGFDGVDAGDGWLIFALPPGEIAVHPGSGWGRGPGHHALFFMCQDIEQTVEELRGRGVEFVSPIEDEAWGRIAQFKIPGAGEIGVYEPRHPSPLGEFAQRLKRPLPLPGTENLAGEPAWVMRRHKVTQVGPTLEEQCAALPEVAQWRSEREAKLAPASCAEGQSAGARWTVATRLTDEDGGPRPV